MTRWVLARVAERCGSCTHAIAEGDPLLELHVGQYRQVRRVRCPACARSLVGEEPPAEIFDVELWTPQPSLLGARPSKPTVMTPEEAAQRARGFRRRGGQVGNPTDEPPPVGLPFRPAPHVPTREWGRDD